MPLIKASSSICLDSFTFSAKAFSCTSAINLSISGSIKSAGLQVIAFAPSRTLSKHIEEDALINGMFAQVGWKFLVNRGNASAFEAAPDAIVFRAEPTAANALTVNPITETYIVNVDGRNFNVTVGPPGAPLAIKSTIIDNNAIEPIVDSGAIVYAPMAGNILKILVDVGSTVVEGEVVVIMEAMKMETEVRSKYSGIVSSVHIKEGGAVAGGNALVSL